MIYNWTPFVEGENKIEFNPVTFKDARQAAPKEWKSATGDREYFFVEVIGTHLTDQDQRYSHPKPYDIFVFGEETYGLDHLIESKRRGACWKFKLLVHKLVKTVYAPTKSFGATYKT